MLKKSPFANLFSSNAQDAKQLQKIRDRIYYFAWSRDRRDEAKLDWVVSENGVNRNVHLRGIDEARSGSRRDHVDGLPCWLLLANKQISADFTRFIYSVNDLDILVDLKADHTNPNEAKLDTIVGLLQNANFQRYTKSARVRIHFPDKYLFQNLPVFNQHAIDNIAMALDGFQQLTHLSVRVVPMQGPEVYELRLAVFPFYPMSMTNWSIRMLNSRTYNWDIVGGEQLHHLNLAWDLFQETGSLTAAVCPPDDAEGPADHIDQVSEAKGAAGEPKKPAVVQKKNGSQKRKDRKLKALTAVTAPSASKTTSETPSRDTSLLSSSPSMDQLADLQSISVPGSDSGAAAESSHINLPIIGMPKQSAPKPSDPVPVDHSAAGTAGQLSTSASWIKQEDTSGVKQTSASGINDDAVETDNAVEQRSCIVDPIKTAPEQHVNPENRQEVSPSSSVPSSVTLGRDQSEDEAATRNTVEEIPQVETTMRGAGADSKKAQQKKRRSRKKSKKTRLTDAAANQSNEDRGQRIPVEPEDSGGTIFIGTISTEGGVLSMDENFDGFVSYDQKSFSLADITELSPWDENARFLRYKTTNGRWGFIQRSSDLDRLLRQKERMAAQETERQAEKLRAKGIRKTKKVKEVMIRRKGRSDGLRRRVEDTKQVASGNQGSDLRKRFNEITGECHEKEATVAHNSSEDFDSSDEDNFSQEGEWSSSETADYPQRHSSIRHEHLDTTSVSHGRKPSRINPAAGPGISLPTQVFLFPNDDDKGEDGSQAKHQDVKGLGLAGIGYNDESASFHLQDHEQRTMTGVAGHIESRSGRGLSNTAATSFASAHQLYHQDHQMDEQRLVEELEDLDDGASVVSHYGDEEPPTISDDESQSPNAW